MNQRTAIYNATVITPAETLPQATVWIDEGHIVQISNSTPSQSGWHCIDAQQSYLIPSWIDTHIHGMGGFGPELASPQALLDLSITLGKQGVGAFCPTLYCARPKEMADLLQKISSAIGHEKGATMIGFHLEGPFISPQKPGVMKPQDIAPANLDDFTQIYEAAQGHIAIVTLAPELEGIDPIIKFCLQHHILVQAGHTNATYEQMQAAVDKGVRRVTHWGNAMSAMHQRAPGVLGAALLNPQISCEVIADGKHVHPALLTLLRQIKPISQISAITDALLPTHQEKGPFIANQEELEFADGVWKRKKDHVTAGSALTMQQAFVQLLQAGYTLPDSVRCTSTNAANLLSLEAGKIQLNAPANLVLLSPDYQIQHIWLNGNSII